ncbi:MAG: DUF1499 domain-containing protein [Methylocystis sp.]
MRRHLPPEPLSKAAYWSLRLGLFSLAVAALAVALARAHKLDPSAALATIGGAIALALVAILLFGAACVTIWRSGARGFGAAVGGLFFALLTLGYPGFLAVQAIRYPVLADISTDPDDPPEFSRTAAALAARGGYTPVDPPAATRATQTAAYPDVQPIVVDLDMEEALAAVMKTAAARGWRLVDKRPPSARSGDAHVDFLVKTQLLGFDEDATVRLRPLAGQTRIDLRAASRYGRHDFGANASRIEDFAEGLQAQVE